MLVIEYNIARNLSLALCVGERSAENLRAPDPSPLCVNSTLLISWLIWPLMVGFIQTACKNYFYPLQCKRGLQAEVITREKHYEKW